jgi:2-polyprenyl-3-methyl-5-hydroxy-6-metoxy-1,4-benzoquinol methylase
MDYNDYKNNVDNNFWYKSRKKLIDHLLSLYLIKKDRKRLILEIGCGTGYQLEALKKWGTIQGVDINKKSINIAKKSGLDVKLCNAETDNIGINKFDVICLFDVLEHIENDTIVIKKIYGSLKNNSLLFLTVPAYNYLYSDHDIAMKHYRRYNKKKLIETLKKFDFEVIENGYWNSLLFPVILLIRLSKKITRIFKKRKIYKSEATQNSGIINNILYFILLLENFLISKEIRIPYGLSIFIVAKKNIKTKIPL